MKFKSLLLGTAAAFAVTGGAQAADLAIAVEPIDYVKVCDAFGVGYHYIPGTDTCLKIGGHARMDIWIYDDDRIGNIYGLGVHEDEIADEYGYFPADPMFDDYNQNWEFRNEANVNFTAKTMTDLGPVITHATFLARSRNQEYNGYTKWAYLDNLYGAIGPLLFGWTNSTFDPSGGFTYDGARRSDEKVDQIRFSYLLGTWGIMLGLEDPRDRYDNHAKNATGDYPDIVLALTGGAGGLDWKLSGAVTDRTTGTGWGVNFQATADLGAGARIRGNVAYSDNQPSYVGVGPCVGTCPDEGTYWSAFLSGMVALTGNLDAAATVSYIDGPAGFGHLWEGAIGAYWHPTAKSEIGLEFLYQDPENSDSSWGIHTRLQTNFN